MPGSQRNVCYSNGLRYALAGARVMAQTPEDAFRLGDWTALAESPPILQAPGMLRRTSLESHVHQHSLPGVIQAKSLIHPFLDRFKECGRCRSCRLSALARVNKAITPTFWGVVSVWWIDLRELRRTFLRPVPKWRLRCRSSQSVLDCTRGAPQQPTCWVFDSEKLHSDDNACRPFSPTVAD